MSGKWTQIASLQVPLDAQLRGLAKKFSADLLATDVLGVLLTGSCSRGDATYRSDIDLLVVLKGGPLGFSRVRSLRSRIENAYLGAELESPLQAEFHFVLESVFETREPAMRSSLGHAIAWIDPTGSLKSALAGVRKGGVAS